MNLLSPFILLQRSPTVSPTLSPTVSINIACVNKELTMELTIF